MELTQLRYFLEVAKTQHITQTAAKLHITQPALTKMIHHLESDLGIPLFVAKGRGIMLTEYGIWLQKRLTPIMKELDAIPEEIHAMTALENVTIHLNVLAASSLVTQAIAQYRKEHLNVHFQMFQNSTSPLYDIGVMTKLFYQLPEKEQNHEFVVTERIFLAVPDSHPLAQRKKISLYEAADEDFVSLNGSRQLRLICDRFCQQAGFTPNVLFESDSPAAVRNMISSNMGVGFWPEFTWGELESDSVHLLEITDPICQRDILFDCRNNKEDCTEVLNFFHYLQTYCKNIKEKHEKAAKDLF